MSTKHAPEPWDTTDDPDAPVETAYIVVDAHGDVVADCGILGRELDDRDAIAAHIVECVNRAPEMVAGNNRLKAALRHEIRTTDKAEAQRDTLLMAAGDILQRKYAHGVEPTHDEWVALRNAVIDGQGSS